MKTISFPHMGDYSVPIKFMVEHLTTYEVKVAPPITKRTLDYGSKNSPDFVCLPFKYNLGNYIETLENGADILIQSGGGCRFGYYGEVQMNILKNKGYKFDFYSIANDNGKMNLSSVYKAFKKLNPKLNIFIFFYYIFLTILMIILMDRADILIRKNIGFANNSSNFVNLKNKMLASFSKTTGYINLIFSYFKYRSLLKKIPINKPHNCLKVGFIGELYTAMEPFASYNIEIELAKKGVEVKRFTNLTYLLLTKHINKKYLLMIVKRFVKYPLGADALDNIARTKWLCKKRYDGIIHTKPFGCMPEVNAIPIMDKVAKEYEIPIIYLSFDSQTSEEGIKTRLEAFYDIIAMKQKSRWN